MDASNLGEHIYDTCPVCGDVRVGYSNINLMICRNYYCPVRYYLMPKDIKTKIEAMTYAGWLPDKDSARRTVYFNPRFEWFSKHAETLRRDNERKAVNLITNWIGGDDDEA